MDLLRLYREMDDNDEVPVVVCAADSHLTSADELTLADLAGDLRIDRRVRR